MRRNCGVERRTIKVNRQIEFRGKRIDNGEWVYGSLYGEQTIIENIVEYGVIDYFGVDVGNFHKVDQSTVGQFTGLVDKKKLMVYEGDIIELIDRHVVVIWNKYLAQYDLDFLRYNDYVDNEFVFEGVKMFDLYKYEVIGNIFDKEKSNV